MPSPNDPLTLQHRKFSHNDHCILYFSVLTRPYFALGSVSIDCKRQVVEVWKQLKIDSLTERNQKWMQFFCQLISIKGKHSMIPLVVCYLNQSSTHLCLQYQLSVITYLPQPVKSQLQPTEIPGQSSLTQSHTILSAQCSMVP